MKLSLSFRLNIDVAVNLGIRVRRYPARYSTSMYAVSSSEQLLERMCSHQCDKIYHSDRRLKQSPLGICILLAFGIIKTFQEQTALSNQSW